jgi:hypothetical protein
MSVLRAALRLLKVSPWSALTTMTFLPTLRSPQRIQLTLATLLLVVASGAPTILAQPAVVPVVIAAPEPRAFDLVLNEVWLRRPIERAREMPQLPNPNLRHVAIRGAHAVFAVDDTLTPLQLAAALRQLEAANPESEGHLVLYERGAVHNDAHRSLLTREVAILLQAEATLPDALSALGAQPFSAVPGAFIVRADDPLAAVALADTLRTAPGVRLSYPLLKRQGFAR